MSLTPPPFDPELAAALEILLARLPGSFDAERIRELRAGMGAATPSDEQLSCAGFFEVEDRLAPGPDGGPDVPLLVCRPAKATGPRPVFYFAHGGGMVIGNNRVGVEVVLDWARQLDAVVVSVEYRLAPENPHPAPVEDVYAGLVWVAGHAAEIGGDPGRIIVAGTSAGGGLAAASALLARDRKGPQLLGQVLMCPMLDDRNDTPSAVQMTGLGVWDRTANEQGWSALLGERRGTPEVPAHAAPARAEDLSGLPPAFLDVGSAETFRDEVVAYASRIWRSGGVAELHVWPGGFHGFDTLMPQAALSQAACAARLTWLRRLLGE
ncbi:alpha/beta hydrolase [Streptomyces sp. NPDC005820]|uniref:alpha/beta hydrolase n=1 Tax=Streptomyces sp. NPDC005820 TaxID=3157069 RepID=UPI0033C074D8